ncbi:MAG: Bug family tripartite tricarboxylate transporter substrate binding protein [Burkholderiaceae bacterium]
MKQTRRQFCGGLAAGSVLASTVGVRSAHAQAAAQGAAQAGAYPNRPIKLIVPYGAGSATDVQGRLILPKMSEVLGQPVLVENRPGATGVIGAEMVARSAPDGYTLMIGTNATHATMQSLTKLPYVVMRDFSFIGRLSSTPAFVIVNNDVPAKTLPEFIAWAKTQPQGVVFGSTGNGGSGHLSSELIGMKTGIKLIHVPYKDGGQAVTDLMSGQIKMMSYFASILPHVRAGRLRALAVLADKRSPSAPDLPTAAEQGLPGLEVAAWAGMFGPAGIPQPIVNRLWGALEAALNDSTLREQFAKQGVEPLPLGLEPFRQYCEAEATRWAEVIRTAGLKLD